MNPARQAGIDVSKDRLDIFLLPEREAFAVTNDQQGIDSLLERLQTARPDRNGGSAPQPASSSTRPSVEHRPPGRS